MKDNFEDILFARLDELLDACEERILDPDEVEELDALTDWYETWLDYIQVTDTLRLWYEKH